MKQLSLRSLGKNVLSKVEGLVDPPLNEHNRRWYRPQSGPFRNEGSFFRPAGEAEDRKVLCEAKILISGKIKLMAKKHSFKPVSSQVSFPQMEEEVLRFWKEKKVFEKSVEQREGKKPFVFYEGPPTANGKPGSHHVEARAFKDLIPRYKTMSGFYCDRKGGWDCHGLPVEIEVEKKLGISGKQQIEEYGIEKFNKLCRESVFAYVEDWEKLTDRIGFWIDMRDPYVTMNNSYIESDWAILKELSDKGLLYEDYKVVPYCARCGTPLSSHELALGYKDNVPDMSVFVKFKVKGKEDTYLLAWTTTPWTLPGNVALAVGPDAEYVEVKTGNESLILAEARLAVLGSEKLKVVKRYKGKELVNWEYEPLYDFVKYDKKAHYVIPADFVSLEEGTGIVHTAVMYGEDDFNLGQKYNLPKKHVVNERGEFISEVKPWAGMFVKKADPLIIEDLQQCKLLFKKEEILHTYPFCWRCGTPLLYYALTSWYLKTTAVKDKLIANNESVNWIPEHIKEGRMGEWLRNNKDWALSRSRYWGTPLPIWRCSECSETTVVGSVAKLTKLSGEDQSILDLHRPYVDAVKWSCKKCDGEMRRLPFVLDCWFDSGAMPYAQWHYPFENKEKFKSHFPADYICEAMDQTRGWFYTLQAEATLKGLESPYKNVICLGLILDEKGNKMSKSKGNIVDPWGVISEAGADAFRWYVYSTVTPGESFRFSTNLVKEVNRRFLLILWNVYNFFVTYATLDKWTPTAKKEKSKHILDRWILSYLNKLVGQVTEKLDNYDIYGATSLLETFVTDFSTWYIRRSRDRKGPEFYQTTYEVLVTLCKLMAPFTPFISEEMYRNLTGKESVHLADWPVPSAKIDEELFRNMEVVRELSAVGNTFRKQFNISSKIPIKKATYTAKEEIPAELLSLVKDEVNIKELSYDKNSMGGNLSIGAQTDPGNLDLAEGEARKLVRDIQNARKELGCKLDEKIIVRLPDWPKEHEEYIKKETLAVKLVRDGELRIERV